jgi:hypothetical protein
MLPDKNGANLELNFNSTGRIFGGFDEMKAIELNYNSHSRSKINQARFLFSVITFITTLLH